MLLGSYPQRAELHRWRPDKKHEEETAMPKLLSSSEIERFRNEGYLAPIRVMSEDEAAAEEKAEAAAATAAKSEGSF